LISFLIIRGIHSFAIMTTHVDERFRLLFSRFLCLLVEVFINVSIQSVLVMNVEDDERFICLCLFAGCWRCEVVNQILLHGDCFLSGHSAEMMCQAKLFLFGVNSRLRLAGLGRKERKGARQTSLASKATSVPDAIN